MKINMNKKTIELTKAEMKNAMVFGTDEYPISVFCEGTSSNLRFYKQYF